MLTRQRTRCLRTHSFSLRAGIAYADAYAGSEVLIATPLLRINYWVLDAAHVKSFPVGYPQGFTILLLDPSKTSMSSSICLLSEWFPKCSRRIIHTFGMIPGAISPIQLWDDDAVMPSKKKGRGVTGIDKPRLITSRTARNSGHGSTRTAGHSWHSNLQSFSEGIPQVEICKWGI